MSKAFTRESDDGPDRPAWTPVPSPLPAGMKNYLTRDGAQKMQDELDHLLQVERPRAAASLETSVDRAQVHVVYQRIQYLQRSLQSAVIAPVPAKPWDRVRFGATVTVRDASGSESHYRIVGVDETDLDRGWVSWLSPIAKALLNASLGQHVRFRFPEGEQDLEVTGIEYE